MVVAAGGVALVAAITLSLSVGSNPIPIAEVWDLLASPDGSHSASVVHELRLPRTVIGVVVGAALGMSGALMQSLTRNPLADPGILGINAGAGFAVVIAVVVAGATNIGFYLWFAFIGAAAAAVGVYSLGTAGRQAAAPVRLALAGVAISAALTALTQTIVLADQVAFNEFRFWIAGSLDGRTWPILAAVGPFIAVGTVIALMIGPSLNALSLGDSAGRALGVHVRRTRTLAMVAITLLCGAATAAAGPIAFVGLAIPFVARALVGSDQRWVGVVCALLGPVFLLCADVFARVVAGTSEVQVGIVTALIGAPVFVVIVRRHRIAAL